MVKEETKTIVKETTTTKSNSGKKKSSTSKTKTKKPAVKKKTTKKRTASKRKTLPKPSQTMTKKEAFEFEERIIDNFVSMQKVMTHLAENFDELSKQLSKLLNLFDQSAKALTQKEVNLELKGGQKENEILEKLNSVLDQNKLIAKGLTLMHEHNSNMSNKLFSNDEKKPQMSANGVSMYPAPKPSEDNKQNDKDDSDLEVKKMPKQSEMISSRLNQEKAPKSVEEGQSVFNSGEFS